MRKERGNFTIPGEAGYVTVTERSCQMKSSMLDMAYILQFAQSGITTHG